MPITIYWELWRHCPYCTANRKHVYREGLRGYLCSGCNTHVWRQSTEKWRLVLERRNR